MLLLLSVSLKHPVNFLSHSLQSASPSKHWKKAESHTFYPQHKKVLLTPEGELLLQHVKPAIQMLDEENPFFPVTICSKASSASVPVIRSAAII